MFSSRQTRPSPTMAPLVLSLLALSVVSCASVGPKTIPRDQIDYGSAIRTAGREQFLFNMVGLRYLDAPVFLSVASVINQYVLEGEVALGAGANTAITGEDTVSIGGAGRFSDRPTITYTPLAGREFAENLLTPIPPESLFALVQAGWPPELLFGLTVSSINGVENHSAGPASRRQADPRFLQLLAAWGRLRKANVIGLRRATPKEEEKATRIVVYANASKLTEATRKDLAFVRDTLGLPEDLDVFTLRYGLLPEAPGDIAVLTNSILEIMNDLAWQVDVPAEHIEEGRTGTTYTNDDPDLPPLIRVHHAKERPEDAYAAVHNRGYWFYIDDRDVISKRTFAIVQVIFSLTDTGDKARGPVLTIGN